MAGKEHDPTMSDYEQAFKNNKCGTLNGVSYRGLQKLQNPEAKAEFFYKVPLYKKPHFVEVFLFIYKPLLG